MIDAPLSPEQQRRSMIWALVAAPFYGAWWSVALGTTTVLYLRNLGFEKSQIGFLLGGAVVTETMFAWPGVGRMAVGAITSSDFPLAQGAILMLAVGFIAINLGVDVIYAYLDPRIGRA